MILFVVLLFIAIQVYAYKFALRVKMKFAFLKVLIVFLILDFSVYPYIIDMCSPANRLPGFTLEDSNFIYRCWMLGAIIIVLTHLIYYMNHKTSIKKQRIQDQLNKLNNENN